MEGVNATRIGIIAAAVIALGILLTQPSRSYNKGRLQGCNDIVFMVNQVMGSNMQCLYQNGNLYVDGPELRAPLNIDEIVGRK